MINTAALTQAYAEPGANHLIDAINPETGLTLYGGKTLEQIRQEYPTAELVNLDQWMEAKAARQETPITWHPSTQSQADWARDGVYPAAWGPRGSFLCGEPHDHSARDGAPRYQAHRPTGEDEHGAPTGWEVSGRPMTIKEFNAIK